ncbi:MAG: glycosyltransferase family 4 protein [Candidatus Cloacimonadales bacterium]|nr:glycosyltransferase family 4 protein [Candidatus Cloacimonadales bacterium]
MNNIRSIQIIGKLAFDDLGASESLVWNMSRSFRKKGFQTEILSTKVQSEMAGEFIEDVPIKRFEYFYPYFNLSDEAKAAFDQKDGNPYSWQMYRYLQRSPGVDILHSHAPQRLSNLVRLAARKQKIPYVISLFEAQNKTPETGNEKMEMLLEGTLHYGKLLDSLLKTRNALQDADGILCLGKDECRILQQRYPDKIVEYIPNGVDIDKFKIGPSRHFRERYNINNDADIILCAGRIDPQKNQLKLVELVNLLNQKHKSTHLLLIGQIASESYYQKIQHRIQELHMEDRITIIPGLNADDPELVKAYHAADFFILPSIKEPFGIVALEAWASRLPVIAHKVGGLQNLITEKHNGLFYQNDSLEDLAAKYYLLKDHPDLRVKLIHNAYEEVCGNYCCQIIAEKILDFYQRVIEKYRVG